MYLITVIPLKRKLPDGQLSYISKTKLEVNSIINVPLKKKTEVAFVVDVKKVSDEKSYIKSLPWKLITLNDDINNDTELIFDFDLNKIISEFSLYSMSPVDNLVRHFLSSVNKVPKIQKEDKTTKEISNKNKKDIKNILYIVSSDSKLKKYKNIQKENKEDKEENEVKAKDKASNTSVDLKQNINYVTLHNFLNYFLKNSINIDNIVLDDPEGISSYGMIYLGFDPTAFIVLMAKKLNIEITFNSYIKTIRYDEWKIKQNLKIVNNDAKIRILSRENEKKNQTKQYPLSPEISDFILNNYNKGEKILIICSGKNFAPKTICSDCSNIHSCLKCKNPLRLVRNNRNYAKKYGIAGNYIYICFNCNTASSALVKCINCDSWNLKPLGYGIERIIENINEIIPKNKHNLIYDFSERISVKSEKIWQQDGGIVIASIYDINEIQNYDTCIIPSLGAIMYGNSFDDFERARSIINYGKKANRGVVVSVMQDTEKVFLETDDNIWNKEELKDRKDLHYPPYSRYVLFKLDSYASKAIKIQDAIVGILNKFAIKDTVVIKKTTNDQIYIAGSFVLNSWSINNQDYSLPIKIHKEIYPFLKYLSIVVY